MGFLEEIEFFNSNNSSNRISIEWNGKLEQQFEFVTRIVNLRNNKKDG